MGVFKEHANAFEAIAKKQRQIYSDAADFGFPYKRGDAPNEVALLIHYVNDLKKTSLTKSRETWGDADMKSDKPGGVEVVIEIAWEIDEGFECGTRYNISFSKDKLNRMDLCANCNAFISIDIESYRKPYKK